MSTIFTKLYLKLAKDYRALIREYLHDCFDLTELKTFTFDLGTDYEEFDQTNKSIFLIALLSYVERKFKVDKLLEMALKKHNDRGINEILQNFKGIIQIANGLESEITRLQGLLQKQEELANSQPSGSQRYNSSIKIFRKSLEELEQISEALLQKNLVAEADFINETLKRIKLIQKDFLSFPEDQSKIGITCIELKYDHLIDLARKSIEVCIQQERDYREDDCPDYLTGFKVAQNNEITRLKKSKRKALEDQENRRFIVSSEKLRKALIYNFKDDEHFNIKCYNAGIPLNTFYIEDIETKVEYIIEFCEKKPESTRGVGVSQALKNLLQILIYEKDYELTELSASESI